MKTWRCPACSTPIRLGLADDGPRTNAIYRCAACRLELVHDKRSDKMIVRPMTQDDRPPRRK